MIDLKTGNVLALIIAVVVSAGGIAWQQARIDNARKTEIAEFKAVPSEAFFEVKNVSVPDFIEGENPLIVYDRQVKKTFYGAWNVEVHQVGGETDYAYCSGSGANKYEPKEQLPKVGVKFDWFIGKECHLPAGQYILQVNWEIHPDGYPPKFQTFTSNIFRVFPQGSQLFVTPEQSHKLEKVAP